jgi:hypothetical protein
VKDSTGETSRSLEMFRQTRQKAAVVGTGRAASRFMCGPPKRKQSLIEKFSATSAEASFLFLHDVRFACQSGDLSGYLFICLRQDGRNNIEPDGNQKQGAKTCPKR